MEGVPECECVGTGFKLSVHGAEVIPCVFKGSMLRILINSQDFSIDVEDNVLMILILVA
jgi:hypothetical protein